MRVLRFKCGQPEWLIPLNELSTDMKHVLRLQWREFINELGDVDERSFRDQGDSQVIAMLEKAFAAPASS